MAIKTFSVKYVHGHFIDQDTGLRINPIQGEEYVITAETRAFDLEDSRMVIAQPLNSLQKEKWVKRKYVTNSVEKIMSAGEQLFYRVGNSKKISGDESWEYIFLCTLKEDLYLFLTHGGKKENSKDWRLVDCQCELVDCLRGGLTLSEKIVAESINKLFTQTVMFYFSLQRSGSTNVFSTFCLYDSVKNKEDITFSGILANRYKNLGHKRNEVAKRWNQVNTDNSN